MVAPADLSPPARKTKLIESTNEWPEWLPIGWKVELQAPKSGSEKLNKCYVDPSTGCKFYSKAQVLRFLRNMEQKSSTSKQKEMQLPVIPTSKVTTENSTVKGLPPGWKKEIKARKFLNKTKRDQYYIDPVNGYVFSSKMDVQRYLETGDISSCAKKPTKRDIQEKSPPSSATKRQKLENCSARDQSVGGDGVSGVGSVTSSGGYSLRNRTKTTSTSTTVPSPISVEISSRRTPTKDATGPVEKSNKKGSAPVKAEELDQNSVNKSRDRKWLDLPRRYSKRLAGDEPDMSPKVDKKQGDDSAVVVRALPKTVRPPDDETAQSVDLNISAGIRSKLRKELLDSPSDGKIPSNERQGCDLAPPMMTKEADENSRATVFDATNLHVLIPEADKKQEKKSRESNKKQRSHENNSRASTKRKKFDLLSQPSKDGWADEIVGMPSTLGETFISFSGIDAIKREDELPNSPSQARGKRTTFNVEQVKILERDFELETHPKPERRIELARALGLEPRQVQVWFQNRRARLKREQLQEDHEHLQRQFEAVQTENQYLHAEAQSGLENPSPQHGEISNDYRPFFDTTDKPQIAEVLKSHDKKPEPELIPPLVDILSDPCLEFAFKTLTGSLPAEASSADEPFAAFAANMMCERNLTTENMGRNIEVVVPVGSKLSKTTEKLSPHLESLEFQPKAVSSPIVNNTNHFASGERLQAQQASGKPEQQPFVSFAHWSDPSFGSAFKTLSRSMPDRSYFGQQAEPSQFQTHGFLQQQSRDASSTLSHFGMPNFYRPDISARADSSEKQVFPPLAMPLNNQSLFSSCSNIDSQPPPPAVNKNLMTPPQKRGRGRPRKVNS